MTPVRAIQYTLSASIASLLCSCSSYTQHVMFKTPADFTPDKITKAAMTITEGYTLQTNDQLYVDVFSNKGERIVDPYPESQGNHATQLQQQINYVISGSGAVRLPMVGDVALEGLTQRSAEEKVQQAYEVFFQEPYVTIRLTNKRVVLLSGTGGQVVPLTHQNMRLTEVLALGKGLSEESKSSAIKVLRGKKIFLIDLSTLEGYAKSNIIIQPDDIIYVAPTHRPVRKLLKDYSGFMSLLTSLASLIIVIVTFSR